MSGRVGPRNTRRINFPALLASTQQLKLTAQMIIKRFLECFDSAIRTVKKKKQQIKLCCCLKLSGRDHSLSAPVSHDMTQAFLQPPRANPAPQKLKSPGERDKLIQAGTLSITHHLQAGIKWKGWK